MTEATNHVPRVRATTGIEDEPDVLARALPSLRRRGVAAAKAIGWNAFELAVIGGLLWFAGFVWQKPPDGYERWVTGSRSILMLVGSDRMSVGLLMMVAAGIPILLARVFRQQWVYLGVLILSSLAFTTWVYQHRIYAVLYWLRDDLRRTGFTGQPIYLSVWLNLVPLVLVPLATVVGGLAASRRGFRWHRWLAGAIGAQLICVVFLFGGPRVLRLPSLLHSLTVLQATAIVLVMLPRQRAALERLCGYSLDPGGPEPAFRGASYPAAILRGAAGCAILAFGTLHMVSHRRLQELKRFEEMGAPPRVRLRGEVNGEAIARRFFVWDGTLQLDIGHLPWLLRDGGRQGLREELRARGTAIRTQYGDPRLKMYVVLPADYWLLAGSVGDLPECWDRLWAEGTVEEWERAFGMLQPYFDAIALLRRADYVDVRDPSTGRRMDIDTFFNVRLSANMLAIRAVWNLKSERAVSAIESCEDLYCLSTLLGRSIEDRYAHQGVDGVLEAANKASKSVYQFRREEPADLKLLAEMLEGRAPFIRVPFDRESHQRIDPTLDGIVPWSETRANHYQLMVGHHQEGIQLFDSITIAVAAERYRHRWAEYPVRVSQLVPDFLPTIPRNPFNGMNYELDTQLGAPVVSCEGVKKSAISFVPDPNGPENASQAIKKSMKPPSRW